MDYLLKYNAAATVYTAMFYNNAFVTSPSFAAGNVQISKDGGAFANLAILPSSNGYQVIVNLVAAELQCKIAQITFHSPAGSWIDQVIYLQTYNHASASITNIDANLKQIDEQATNGYNATLKLKQLDIQNSSGNAINANGGLSGHGINLQGGVSGGHGANLTGGDSGIGTAAGNGLNLNGSTTFGAGVSEDQGCGLHILGRSQASPAVKIEGLDLGSGIYIKTASNGIPILMEGGGNGPGMIIRGGPGADCAMLIESLASDKDALRLLGDGTGKDINAKEIGDLIKINGDLVNDNLATLKLKQLDVTNDAGHAIIATSTAIGGHGINANGHAGAGISAYDDATGNGIHAQSDSGDGIHAESDTGDGLKAQSNDGCGLSGHSTNGDGIAGFGGAGNSGCGIKGVGTDQAGIAGYDNGNGHGIHGQATSSGSGIHGESSSGDGLQGESVNGNGISGNSIYDDGISASGGSGTGDHDIRAKEIDNLVRLTDNVDGTSLNSIFELVLSMVNGRFKINTPSVGKITFYKRDNITPLFVCTINEYERTRD